MNRYWLIRGYDSFDTIFEMKVKLGQFTRRQIEDLLRALAAKAGLTYQEIVGAYATRRSQIANNLLEVSSDPKYPSYRCGTNPHFTASIVDEDGKITPFPESNH